MIWRLRCTRPLKKASNDFENLKFNTAIAAMMSLINDFYKKNSVTKGEYKTLIALLNPVAPHITEELWEIIGCEGRVYESKWPVYDEAKTVESTVEIAVQINGKPKLQFPLPKMRIRKVFFQRQRKPLAAGFQEVL